MASALAIQAPRLRGSCTDLQAYGIVIAACCAACHDCGHQGQEILHRLELASGDYFLVCCTVGWSLQNLDLAALSLVLPGPR